MICDSNVVCICIYVSHISHRPDIRYVAIGYRIYIGYKKPEEDNTQHRRARAGARAAELQAQALNGPARAQQGEAERQRQGEGGRAEGGVRRRARAASRELSARQRQGQRPQEPREPMTDNGGQSEARQRQLNPSCTELPSQGLGPSEGGTSAASDCHQASACQAPPSWDPGASPSRLSRRVCSVPLIDV
jgi:hypothetical protein